MNKKLVAAALGLAFAAPVFADASNVTVYGRVHQAVVNQKVDAANGVAAGSGVALENYASRLGVRGVEDLGGGLAVIFAYELAIGTDNSANNSSTTGTPNSGLSTARHSYLGFKDAKWGTFVAGTQDGGNDSQAPLYNQAQNFLGTVNNNAGDLANVGSVTSLANGTATNGSFAGAAAITRTQRASNSFGYAGNIAGVNLSVRHGLNGANDGQLSNTAPGIVVPGTLASRENDLRETEVAADYKIGALVVGAGYQKVSRSSGFDAAAAAAGGQINNVFQLGAKYTFGDLTVGGLYGRVKFSPFAPAAAAGRDDNNAQFALSADYKIGKGGVYGFYGSSERENIARDAQVNQAQVAYYYDLSKRTRAYAGFNRSQVEQGKNGAGVSNGPDLNTDTFVAGVRHNF